VSNLPQAHSGYFSSKDGPALFATWHASLTPARAALLVFPPFGEERKCAERLLVLTARALAAAGVAVLRWDYRGTGDSHGEHAEVRLADWLADARAAWALLGELAPGLPRWVLGARLGGNLALAALPEPPAGMLLWEPLLSGRDQLEELWRRAQIKEAMAGHAEQSALSLDQVLAREEALDLDGFPVSTAMARDLLALELRMQLPQAPPATLLLRVTGASRQPPAWEAISQALAARPPASFKIVRERPFWGRLDYHEAKGVVDESLAYCAATMPA